MRPSVRLFAALLLPFLASCLAAPRPTLIDSNDLDSGQVVIVGKVKLTPPLRKGEQKVDIIGAEAFKNKVLLLCGDTWREVETPIGGDDYKGRIDAPLDRTFFAGSDPKPFYILGGALAVEFVGSQPSYVYFPGGWKVPIQAGQRAVYIGTIHYFRNEFSQITKITVEDEYDEAQGIFARKFGNLRLHKVNLIPVK